MTPPHQDYFYIKGTPDTYTCWIPAGDCPEELGGLAVMPGTNQLGMLRHEPMQGTGGHGVSHERCEEMGKPWLTADFKTGDLLLFHGHTLHKALDNRTEDRLRVSLEYRFQRKKDDIDPGSMAIHMNGAFEQ
jgi:ectoine hydroxylase-related dioxygenase (phytanoyl-CoA dioxygenase family)